MCCYGVAMVLLGVQTDVRLWRDYRQASAASARQVQGLGFRVEGLGFRV
jgi:hypothetical protein